MGGFLAGRGERRPAAARRDGVAGVSAVWVAVLGAVAGWVTGGAERTAVLVLLALGAAAPHLLAPLKKPIGVRFGPGVCDPGRAVAEAGG